MKRFLSFVLAAISTIACTQREIEEVRLSPHGDKIFASIASTETKVQLNDLKQTVWTEGDQIYVIGPDIYAVYQFDGKTGDRSGSFTKTAVGTPPDAYSVYFDQYYAVYSYNTSWSSYDGTIGAILSEIPSVQGYTENSYGLYANTMVATSQDGSNFKFKNVLGYLRLSLAGDQIIRSITIKGNNDETLAGGFYFVLDDIYNRQWYPWHADNQLSKEIILDCGEYGVALSGTPKDFYFVVPPMVFEEGITVSIDFTDGSSMEKSTDKRIEITANNIQPMSVISISDPNWDMMYIYHSGPKVTFPMLTGESLPIGMINFGDGNSHSLGGYYQWIYEDGKPSHTITVKSKNADGFIIQGCDGITGIDLTNF